ncbi:hypothetical protein JCM10908_005321 [Rhodotorula pacifica]|uniref:uncharacterized protein n=1 Tax=Rhodotorula pacifica TaxID=1495444 RepID=UPI00316E7627
MASQYLQHQPYQGTLYSGRAHDGRDLRQPSYPSTTYTASGPSPAPRRYLPPAQPHQHFSSTQPQSYYQQHSYTRESAAPARSAHATQPYPQRSPSQPQPRPSQPPHRAAQSSSSEQQWIKCSSCSELVELEELGDHVCREEAGRNLRSLGVDVNGEWAGPRSATLRVTNPDEDNANASDLLSIPRSPASAIPPSPVSPAPNSSTSTSRLPFFERYQKLVDTSGSNNEAAAAAGQVGSAIPRSPRLALANLVPPSSSPSSTPHLERSHSAAAASTYHHTAMSTSRSEPLLSPPAPTYPVRKNSLPSPRSPHQESFTAPQTPFREDQWTDDFPTEPTVASKSPSRRELVESTYLAYASFGDDDDDHDDGYNAEATYPHAPSQRQTLTPSYSSPADLAGSLTVPAPAADEPFPYSTWDAPAPPASPSGLDACLADLQLLAEGDAAEEGAAGLMIRGFSDEDNDEQRAASSRTEQVARAPTPRSRPPPPPRQDSFDTRLARTPTSCAMCSASLRTASDIRRAGDGQPFCRACYADRYLPKCRKCRRPIEGGAVTSSDGKIAGKYHAGCFGCFECSAPFPDGEFYVFNGKPYCQHDYHALNGSLCAARECGKPIEGSCVSLMGEENGGGGRYHTTCFHCSEPSCRRPLLDYHYIVERRPFCEDHSSGAQNFRSARDQKRQTIVTWR